MCRTWTRHNHRTAPAGEPMPDGAGRLEAIRRCAALHRGVSQHFTASPLYLWCCSVLALLLLLPQPARPDGLPVAKPESAGMSSARLQRISEWLEGIVERKQAAGFVVLVSRRGKVVFHQAYGRRGLTVRDPMPLDALFDIASMTKPVTAVAALTLLEEGRITLDDPISEYLPEFQNPKVEVAPGKLVPAKNPILVRHLFTHTSGISTRHKRVEILKYGTLAAYVHALARQPLRAEPGARWLYGTSHDVLGYLVERVSGEPLDRYVQQRILSPLGMRDTYYWPPKELEGRRAILVFNGKDDLASASRVPPEAAKTKSFIGGSTGLYSTAADYWRFCQMLLDRGVFQGKRILGARTVQWMTQNHIDSLDSFRAPGTRFGLGVAVVTDPGRSGLPYSKGTFYWGGSQGTLFWVDPDEELIGVLMVQLSPNPLKLRERFSALVYSSITD